MHDNSTPLGTGTPPEDWIIVASGDFEGEEWTVFMHPNKGPYELWKDGLKWARVYMAPGMAREWAINVLERGWDERPPMAP